MAISYIGTTGFVSGTGALSVAISSTGAQSGDLLLAFVNTANQGSATLPQVDQTTNFTAVSGGFAGTGTGGNAGATDLRISYRFHTTGTNITYADVGSYQSLLVVALRGVDTSTPVANVATRVDASATTTLTIPSTNSATGSQWLVHAIGLDRDATNAGYQVFSPLQYTGTPTNLMFGDQAMLGAITNAGTGGGLWAVSLLAGGSLTSGTYTDSTTHAQVSFNLNAAVTIPQGSATGSWTITSSTHTGSHTSQGSSSGHGQSITGTAVGSHFDGEATGSWTVTSSTHAGSHVSQGSSSGHGQSITGSAQGSNVLPPEEGSATGTVTITGSASGSHTSSGAASGSVTMTGSTAGSHVSQGSSTGSWTLTPSGVTGARMSQGSSSGHGQSITGSATGFAPVEGMKSGSASGSVTLTGSASGVRAPVGSSSLTSWTITGTASGQTSKSGIASGSMTLHGVAISFVDHEGGSTGVLTIAGTAVGYTPTGNEGHPVGHQTLGLSSGRGTLELSK